MAELNVSKKTIAEFLGSMDRNCLLFQITKDPINGILKTAKRYGMI